MGHLESPQVCLEESLLKEIQQQLYLCWLFIFTCFSCHNYCEVPFILHWFLLLSSSSLYWLHSSTPTWLEKWRELFNTIENFDWQSWDSFSKAMHGSSQEKPYLSMNNPCWRAFDYYHVICLHAPNYGF